jgi:hypothetical protein
MRWTVGGNKVNYPFDVSTKTADLTTAKLLINSIISTPNAQFLTAKLIPRYEYMLVPIWMLPDAIIEQYVLRPFSITDTSTSKFDVAGMYVLPQTGRILANNQIVDFLQPHRYTSGPFTHGLWRHHTRDIVFILVVDNFGVRYTDRTDADHLIATALCTAYEVSLDWTGSQYCGLSLKWDYTKRTCNMSMPGYIDRALQRFQNAPATKPEHAPYPWQPPNFGAKTQYATLPDSSSAIDVADKTRILEVLGTLLFYAHAIDSKMLTVIGELATKQTQDNKTTMDKLAQLLNYCAAHPDATIRFTASNMILAVKSDALYPSVVKGWS